MSNFKLIDGRISKGGQDVTFRYLCSFGEHKVRFTIKSDAYLAQCKAFAQVWSPTTLSWNEVASLHTGEMETSEGLCYRPHNEWDDERHFESDYDRLMTLVREVLV